MRLGTGLCHSIMALACDQTLGSAGWQAHHVADGKDKQLGKDAKSDCLL